MFGYVIAAPEGLSPEGQERYRAVYCGLCRALQKKYGNLSRFTLSYDLTFLALLLHSLYEPEEDRQFNRCLPHLLHPHEEIGSKWIDYCADMNLILAYHKLLDDVQDDGSLKAKTGKKLLQKSYDALLKQYPETCRKVEQCLQEITAEEKSQHPSLDRLCQLSGEMLGAVYGLEGFADYWQPTLIQIGTGLGQFIYLMDAYDDLEEDRKRGRFNPIIPFSGEEDFEEYIKQSLTLLIADAASVFETLPLQRDVDILKNILYSGCWIRYE